MFDYITHEQLKLAVVMTRQYGDPIKCDIGLELISQFLFLQTENNGNFNTIDNRTKVQTEKPGQTTNVSWMKHTRLITYVKSIFFQ